MGSGLRYVGGRDHRKRADTGTFPGKGSGPGTVFLDHEGSVPFSRKDLLYADRRQISLYQRGIEKGICL